MFHNASIGAYQPYDAPRSDPSALSGAEKIDRRFGSRLVLNVGLLGYREHDEIEARSILLLEVEPLAVVHG